MTTAAASAMDTDTDDGDGLDYDNASAPNISNGFDAGIGNDSGPDFWGNFAERAHAT